MAPTTKRKAADAPSTVEAPPRRMTRGQTRQLLNSDSSNSVQQPPPPAKKERKTKKPKTTDSDTAAVADTKENGKAPTVVVEHCKQCNQFKTRALLVEKRLQDGIPGITVLINPDKPRRGCFEIRQEGGETFISLLDMKRPFKPMKDLNMEDVIDVIIKKIKA